MLKNIAKNIYENSKEKFYEHMCEISKVEQVLGVQVLLIPNLSKFIKPSSVDASSRVSEYFWHNIRANYFELNNDFQKVEQI